MMANTEVIYLGTKKRVGKDTLATLLYSILTDRGYSVTTIALADPLKQLTASMFNTTVDKVDECKNNVSPLKIASRKFISKLSTLMDVPTLILERDALLNIGKHTGKMFDSPYVTIMENFVKTADRDFVIITDFRLPEEYFKEGFTIRVNRDSVKTISSPIDIDNKLVDFKFDAVIDNNGTLEDLYNKAFEVTDKIIYKVNAKRADKPFTNIIIDLSPISKNALYLEDSLERLIPLKAFDIRFTLCYNEEVYKKHKNILDRYKNILEYKHSTYIDKLKIVSINNMYNVILLAGENIDNYPFIKIGNYIHKGDVEEIRNILISNRDKAKVIEEFIK